MAGIIAHRGASGLRPENTTAAFRKALEIGVAGIELDVQLSADGQIVVYHDLRLKPEITRDGSGEWLRHQGPPVHALTYDELQSYDVGRLKPGTRYARRYPEQVPVDGERIPLLDHAITLLKDAGTGETLWIELKTDAEQPEISGDPEALADAVVALLDEREFLSRSILISFDWRGLLRARKQSPEAGLGFLSVERPWLDNIRRRRGGSPWTAGFDARDFGGSLPRMVQAAGGDYWSAHFRDVSRNDLAEAHALGIGTNLWTLRDLTDKRTFGRLRADFITTDRPDWFR